MNAPMDSTSTRARQTDVAATYPPGWTVIESSPSPPLQQWTPVRVATSNAATPTRHLRRARTARRVMYVSMACLLAVAGCKEDLAPEKAAASRGNRTVWFEEVAESAGLSFRHRPFVTQRFYFPEIMGGGVGLLDYDNDGDLDAYCVQGGESDPSAPNHLANELYRNRGDGTFENVTVEAGVGDVGYGNGCVCGDYDNDGDVDIYVTNLGPNVLYRNNGNGSFTDVSDIAGVADAGWGSSGGFVDYDADGDLDLLVVNYIRWSPARELTCMSSADQRDYCQPNNYNTPARDTLYRNNGDGSFSDVTEEAGLAGAFGNGLGVAFGDFNSDGLTDFYVANDTHANQLWVNNGGRFTEDALMMGCALSGTGVAEAGMGVISIDADNDGDLDLFMSHLRNESNTFYLNHGGFFNDVTARMGLDASSQAFTGFGTGFADFDCDGDLDLFVANGRVLLQEPILDEAQPYADPNLLYELAADGKYRETALRGGTSSELLECSRGAAFGDIDNDGGVDVVVGNLGGPVHLLRNVHPARGHWAMFRIVNSHGSDAIGAMVKLTATGKVQWRYVQPVYSYCSSNDPRVHFGLGATDTIDDVTVAWPDGSRESFGPQKVDSIHKLRAGQGRVRQTVNDGFRGVKRESRRAG